MLALAFGLGYGPHWVTRPDSLVPLMLIIADGLGYGLLMTALTLRVASIGAVVHVFNMVQALGVGQDRRQASNRWPEAHRCSLSRSAAP